MHRMDGLSAFLYEQERTGAYQHTLKISILDPRDIPGGWSFDSFLNDLSNRLHTIPMFRQKALRVPFGLHHPVWVDDPQFDLRYHVRRVGCPHPGDHRAFCKLVSDVYAWKMDLNKPLWVCWVAESLEDGKVALITLLHHSYTDGTGAARLMEKFFTPEQSEITPNYETWIPEKTPGKVKLVLDALADLPRTWWQSLPQIGKGFVNHRRMHKKYKDSGKKLPPNVFRDAQESPVNVMLGYGRTFVYERFDLEEIRTISKRFGVTINDLFVAIAAGTYRQLMKERGFNPDSGPLVTAIPVSKRPPIKEDDLIGNKSSADYMAMPVHIEDPAARLKAAQQAGDILKDHQKHAEGFDLSSILEITPPFLLHLMDWIVRRKGGRVAGIWGNAALSNVPGPRQALYMGTIPVENWISMGQIMHGMGLNMTVWSYNGNFNLCILADSKLLPDGWKLIEQFKISLDEYRQLEKQNQHTKQSELINENA